MWMTDEHHVRRVIHDFDERGMSSLDAEYRGGRPRRITDADRRQMVAVAGARPDTRGVALTRWSLPRLADHLSEQGVLRSARRSSLQLRGARPDAVRLDRLVGSIRGVAARRVTRRGPRRLAGGADGRACGGGRDGDRRRDARACGRRDRRARLARGVAHAGASCAPRSMPAPSSCGSVAAPPLRAS
jgi:hypothetical protein